MSDATRIVRRDAAPSRAPTPSAEHAGRSRRHWPLRTTLVLVTCALLWNLSQRVPTSPSAGTLTVEQRVAAVAQHEPARLRIGTYNIHGGRGTDGVRDLPRIAAPLQGLDFVGLNEALGAAPWESEDQATTLGRELQMTPLYAPTEHRWRCLEFGNGFLARVDVDHWQVVPLERRYGKSHRNLVHIRARAANGAPVNLVVTHIDRSDDRERREQLRTVGNYFLSLTAPAVLLGDLNSDGDEPALQFVLTAPGVVDPLHEKLGDQTPRHIDWILVRGATATDAGITDAGPSDHPHVWAELVIPPLSE